MESAVMTSALMSSQSAVGFQQMRKEVKKMERHLVEESAHGLKEQSQESAAVASFAYPVASSKHPDARFQSQYLNIQQKHIAVEEYTSSEAVDNLRRVRRVFKAGCQLLSSIQMAKTTRSLQKKRTQVLFPCRYFTEERCTEMERRQISQLKH
ncbi:zinc finger CCCH domain-containing protein 6 [Dorcoceras hygrometricum]|uniref:Zinc finger CCCH domain-containing protein 6 n=1 Tax=Dorcoceras hygrometricum TaxID=472368 RepID=A0A2Z7A4G5_9LAMI|nr:zinc finger CCCH domain-containing protein 6 [Dorcoceras hygrometricum]